MTSVPAPQYNADGTTAELVQYLGEEVKYIQSKFKGNTPELKTYVEGLLHKCEKVPVQHMFIWLLQPLSTRYVNCGDIEALHRRMEQEVSLHYKDVLLTDDLDMDVAQTVADEVTTHLLNNEVVVKRVLKAMYKSCDELFPLIVTCLTQLGNTTNDLVRQVVLVMVSKLKLFLATRRVAYDDLSAFQRLEVAYLSAPMYNLGHLAHDRCIKVCHEILQDIAGCVDTEAAASRAYAWLRRNVTACPMSASETVTLVYKMTRVRLPKPAQQTMKATVGKYDVVHAKSDVPSVVLLWQVVRKFELTEQFTTYILNLVNMFVFHLPANTPLVQCVSDIILQMGRTAIVMRRPEFMDRVKRWVDDNKDKGEPGAVSMLQAILE